MKAILFYSSLLFGILSQSFANSSIDTATSLLNSFKWKKVYLDGAVNGDNSDYFFFYKKGNSNNTVIHFLGGGACFNYETSFPLTTKEAVSMELFGIQSSGSCKLGSWEPIIPNGLGGIFENSRRNPFKDWNVVIINYTTGDFQVGKAPGNLYVKGNNVRRLNQVGFSNTTQNLKWVYKNFIKNPKRILVSGDSAGANSALFWGRKIANHYYKSKVFVLADGFAMTSELLPTIPSDSWNVDIKKEFGVTPAENLTESIILSYKTEKGAAKKVKILHANTVHDKPLTQFSYFFNPSLQGVDLRAKWRQDMVESTLFLSQQSSLNYQYFITDYNITPDGWTDHTAVSTSRFYSSHVNGVTYRKWLMDNVIYDFEKSFGEEFLETE